MSDTRQGNDWWKASDGKWYPPTSRVQGAEGGELGSLTPAAERRSPRSSPESKPKYLEDWSFPHLWAVVAAVGVVAGLIALAVMANANGKRSVADDGFDAVGTTTAPSREECSGSGSDKKCSDYADLRIEGPDGETIIGDHVKISRPLGEGQQHPVLLVYDDDSGFEVAFGGTSSDYRDSADTQYRWAAGFAILGLVVAVGAGLTALVLLFRWRPWA